MSCYFSKRYENMVPYVPGEQPKDRSYIKLNTNESPFPPSPRAQAMAAKAAGELQLYSDPFCRDLNEKAAQLLGISEDEVLFGNGSDELLYFAFLAFCDEDRPAAFPDITYGFYRVYAQFVGVEAREIPLKEDFSICVEDYLGLNRTVFIANPNAPTGLALTLSDIVSIVQSNPNNVVVIDEAYVDFGGESAVPLIHKYSNLLVIQTLSKSRSMAGGRLGFAVGCKELISDLKTIKFSTNPFNVNRMSMAAGLGALEDTAYFAENCRKILENRAWTTAALRDLGFSVPDSQTNFVLAKHNALDGRKLYLKLKEKGVLVRHFDTPRLRDYNRITIGSMEEMQAFIGAVREIMEESL